MARLSFLYALLTICYLFWTAEAFNAPKKARIFLASSSPNLLPPSKDAFYTAPPGFENATPGAVLRVRSAQGLTSIVPNCSSAYNILYRTTDSNYKPSWAVTTLFVPQTTSNVTNSTTSSSTVAPSSALLSYQIPYDSANVDSSPSYTFYGGAADPSISLALSQGWYVTSPDYEGPLASFTAGVQSGHATIDSIRAVLNSGFGLSLNASYAMWGYSGGALASEWAAELAVQYAPEMTFAGVALGGLTPNATSVLETINKSPAAELIVNSIIGVATQDPKAQAYLMSQLKTSGPFNATGFLAARTQSTTLDATAYAGQDVFEYFLSGPAAIQDPIFTSLANRDTIMGYHGVPNMPVYAYKAIHDEISVVADTDALVDRYCAVGAQITYVRNTVGGHVAEATNGFVGAFGFLGSVLSGSFNGTGGCVVTNVTIGSASDTT